MDEVTVAVVRIPKPRRLVGVALRCLTMESTTWWLGRGGLVGASERTIYPTRKAAVTAVRVVGGCWRLVSIYTRRKRGSDGAQGA